MSVLRHALVLSVLVTVAAPATVTAAPVPGVVARKAPATPMVSMYKSPKGMTNNACTNLLADAQALKSIDDNLEWVGAEWDRLAKDPNSDMTEIQSQWDALIGARNLIATDFTMDYYYCFLWPFAF